MIDNMFLNLSLENEEMHSIVAQECNKWSRYINKEIIEKAHFKWLDKEFKANERFDENKRKYRILFSIVLIVTDDLKQKKATLGALAEP